MFLLSCLIVACIIRQVYQFISIHRTRRPFLSIPHAPLDGWFTGHSVSLSKASNENRFADLLIEWTDKYGATIVLFKASRSTIFTTDPAILKEISTDVTKYSKLKFLPNRALSGQKIVGTSSILSGNGLSWAIKRKLMAQFFAKSNMTELFSVCEPHMKGQEVRRWKELVQKGKLIDLHKQLAITFTSYLQVLGFGELAQSPSAMASNVEKLLEAIRIQAKQDKASQGKEDKMFNFAAINMIKQMRGEAKQAVMARYKSMCNSPDEPIPSMDLLGFLIEANLKAFEDKELHETLDIVVDDMMTVIFVWDNLVKQLTSFFMLLNDHPEVQEKMFAELREVPLKTLGDSKNLRYTEMCLLEAMRMSPALLTGVRMTRGKKDTNSVGPYKIKQGKIGIQFSEYVMQNTSRYWKNPKKFDPERWENNFKPEPFTYMPFYAGARGCLAKHVAMMLIKLTVAMLAKNFDFKQQFDAKNPPIMSHNHAVMRINNIAHCYVTPYNITM